MESIQYDLIANLAISNSVRGILSYILARLSKFTPLRKQRAFFARSVKSATTHLPENKVKCSDSPRYTALKCSKCLAKTGLQMSLAAWGQV